MTDPLHDVGGPATAWTTVNTAENFPGGATPLGWTFWRGWVGRATARGMKAAFRDIGVLQASSVTVAPSIDDRFSAAVYGRFAADGDCLRRMADRMPGTSGEALEEQLLGSVRPGVPSSPSRRRYAVVAVRMPAAVVRLPRRLARLRADTDTWWRRVTIPGAIATQVRARAVLTEAAQRFEDVMVPHSIVTLLGTGILDQVRALAAASGHAGRETSFVSGYGGIEEARSAEELWRVSRGATTLEEFLADHGHHAPTEAEISSPASVETRRGERERAEREVRALVEQYRAMRLPDAWVGVPTPETGPPAAAAAVVSGWAVSPGVVEGTARVVLDANSDDANSDDANSDDTGSDDLEPGEILVCRTTDPSWASLFVLAGAVVIDIGGPLSHGAIVARELGIPCAINTGSGTRAVRTGDRIRVDGATGAVRIIEPARERTAP